MTTTSVPAEPARPVNAPLQECEARVDGLQELVAHLSTATTDATAVFAAIHEVAQPLTAAGNFLAAAEQLLSSRDPAAKGRGLEAVHFAQQCLTRTGEVMASIKTAAESQPSMPCPQGLESIVNEALQLFQFDATIVPLIEISPIAACVMGDRVQLGQVTSNLIRNALEATEHQVPRLLRIATRRYDRLLVEVRVEDNGPGISEKMSGLLFSPFSSTKGDGIGVGLSICHAIVEHHQGDIWAEALPVGTALCFTLPYCTELPTEPLRRNRTPAKLANNAIGVSRHRRVG